LHAGLTQIVARFRLVFDTRFVSSNGRLTK